MGGEHTGTHIVEAFNMEWVNQICSEFDYVGKVATSFLQDLSYTFKCTVGLGLGNLRQPRLGRSCPGPFGRRRISSRRLSCLGRGRPTCRVRGDRSVPPSCIRPSLLVLTELSRDALRLERCRLRHCTRIGRQVRKGCVRCCQLCLGEYN